MVQRSKYTRQFCSSCKTETRMVVVGEVPSEVEGVRSGKVWFRCVKCRQVFLVDLDALGKQQEAAARKIELKDCTEYLPTKTYQIGEAIFHNEWSDVGKVKAKEKTSSGGQAIVVSFEKLGERRLIENFKIEGVTSSPNAVQSVTPEISNLPQSEVI